MVGARGGLLGLRERHARPRTRGGCCLRALRRSPPRARRCAGRGPTWSTPPLRRSPSRCRRCWPPPATARRSCSRCATCGRRRRSRWARSAIRSRSASRGHSSASCYRRSARVIALSPGIRDGVLAAGVPPERVALVPNASDLELFDPALDGPPSGAARLGDGSSAATSARWARPTTSAQVVRPRASLPEVTFVLHGRRQAARGARARPAPRRTWCSRLRRPTKQEVARARRGARTPASRSSRTCPCWPPTRPTSCSTPSPPAGRRS